MYGGKPASADDSAWAERELEKMMREESLSRPQALAILEKEAPALYGMVVNGVLPKPMTEAERRQWAEQHLAEIIDKEGLSRDEAIDSMRKYAPTVAEWLRQEVTE